MYAVVRSGGKEYRVSKGDILQVEKLEGKVGDEVKLNDVLVVSDEGQTKVGTTILNKVVVTGEIVQQIEGRKILTYKMKKRKNYRRMKGHRQPYTHIKVNDISIA
jgi:large subunit ribosomal protein L21